MRHSVTCYQVSREVQMEDMAFFEVDHWNGVFFLQLSNSWRRQHGFSCSQEIKPYCWWTKSCTTWDVWSLVNSGINYLITNWCRISSINSTSQFLWFLFSTLGTSIIPIRFHPLRCCFLPTGFPEVRKLGYHTATSSGDSTCKAESGLSCNSLGTNWHFFFFWQGIRWCVYLYIYVYIPCHKVPWCSRINRNILIQVWISNVCVSYNIYTSYYLLYLFSRQKLPLGETAQAAHPTCSWKTQCIYFEPRSQVKIVGLLTYSFMRQNVSPQMSFFQLIHRVKP